MNKFFSLLSALFLLQSDPPLCDGASCIPVGGSCLICVEERVCLLPGNILSGEQGTVWEEDWLNDDEMGSTPLPDKIEDPKNPGCYILRACAEIRNVDGDLVGPNGQDQNGGTEGDNIEVYVCMTYRVCYQGTITGITGIGVVTNSGNMYGVGASSTKTGLICEDFKVCTQPIVCRPC